MLASDYVETIVSEMNPRCGNFVSCWLGLWQTYPGPKITGKHCVDRSFITLLYSPSILSIDLEETDCTVWIKSGISLLMLESQHVLFTYSKAEIFRNWLFIQTFPNQICKSRVVIKVHALCSPHLDISLIWILIFELYV